MPTPELDPAVYIPELERERTELQQRLDAALALVKTAHAGLGVVIRGLTESAYGQQPARRGYGVHIREEREQMVARIKELEHQLAALQKQV